MIKLKNICFIVVMLVVTGLFITNTCKASTTTVDGLQEISIKSREIMERDGKLYLLTECDYGGDSTALMVATEITKNGYGACGIFYGENTTILREPTATDGHSNFQWDYGQFQVFLAIDDNGKPYHVVMDRGQIISNGQYLMDRDAKTCNRKGKS